MSSEADGHYQDPRYYDRAYSRYKVDLAFYLGLAERFGGPVLELGVGTGRVAMALADAGHEVVGVDRMPGMLRRAAERIEKRPRRIRDRITLMEGDFRDVRVERAFGLVIAPFNCFQHLYTRDDVERALATVRTHLAPGGRFGLDVLLPLPYSLSRDPNRYYRCRPIIHPKDGRLYDYAEAFDYDAARQVQVTTMRFTSRSGAPTTMYDHLTQRQFFPLELEALFHYNGLVIETHDGGFEGEAITEESDSQIIVARART
ncbi:MAG: class I SAM-dependent methyltransferase [Sandaracinaceae bacterium]